MLTNIFKKMIMTLNGNNTGITVEGTQGTMYQGNSNNISIGTYTLGYNNNESTSRFVKELGNTVSGIFTYGNNNSNNAFNFYDAHSYKSTLAMLVGTSDTPPTVDDIKLGNQIQLTHINDSCSMIDGVISLIREFQNNTESEVTIKEVGLYVISGNTGGASSSFENLFIFLVGRNILQTPVTIPIGDIASFQYRIDFKLNTEI